MISLSQETFILIMLELSSYLISIFGNPQPFKEFLQPVSCRTAGTNSVILEGLQVLHFCQKTLISGRSTGHCCLTYIYPKLKQKSQLCDIKLGSGSWIKHNVSIYHCLFKALTPKTHVYANVSGQIAPSFPQIPWVWKNQWVWCPGHLVEVPPRGKFATFAQVSDTVTIGFLWVVGINVNVLQGQGRGPGFHQV